MNLENLKETLPDYAKDIKLNLSNLLNSSAPLTEKQLWGVILSAALTSQNSELINCALMSGKNYLTSEYLQAIKIAVSLMAMNNIYYRFTHLVSNNTYANMPAQLRMTALASPGIDSIDFELFALSISAINGCGLCMDSHEKILLKKGVSVESIQSAVRISAIIYSLATVLRIKNF